MLCVGGNIVPGYIGKVLYFAGVSVMLSPGVQQINHAVCDMHITCCYVYLTSCICVVTVCSLYTSHMKGINVMN